MSTPRPVVTNDMIREAAKPVAEALDGDLESIVSQYTHPMDGYELAKDLENYCCWEVSRQQLDELDEVEGNVNVLLLAAEKRWAEENNIQPPFPIGAMTTIGVITDVFEYRPATYLIKVHGQIDSPISRSRRVVKFEDVVLADLEQGQ